METLLKHCSILVTDDDADDRLLIKRAMTEGGLNADLHFMEDGQALVDSLEDHLKSVQGQANPAMPCLILLDLNMPRLDGRSALKLVKAHSVLKEIPVVVLSSSKNPDDIAGSYKDGANSFFTKPMDYRGLVQLMELLKAYWFQTAKLPFERA